MMTVITFEQLKAICEAYCNAKKLRIDTAKLMLDLENTCLRDNSVYETISSRVDTEMNRFLRDIFDKIERENREAVHGEEE